ncbi:VOC family protein [Cellulomonas sp.]|uniref:VOC family protein n=1 Tax=Cellulomonas sp. TaxID=40001 RepID=UPI003BAAC333
MGVVDELMAFENDLARGRGREYERVLHEDAVVVVPGAVLTRAGCVLAVDASPGWDEVELGEPRLVESRSTATVVYPFVGRRGGVTYRATLSSTYTRDQHGRWRLLVHQQTPRDEPSGHTLPRPTQVNLVVADVVRAGAFYRDLGWDVGEPADPHAEIRFDGLSVELDEHSSVAYWNSGSPDDDAAATVLSIHLPSRDAVDDVWTRMTALGHESRQRPFDAFFGSRFAVLADPDGHQIGLLSPRSDEHRSDPPTPAPA